MKIYSVVAILLLLTLFACDRREKYVPASAVPVDSFELQNVHTETTVSYYPTDSTLLISYVSSNGKQVVFYDAEKRAVVDSMNFSSSDFDKEYYPSLNNELYVYNVKENELLVRNETGNQQSYKLAEEVIHQEWDSFRTTYSGICPTLEVIDSVLIMNVMHGYHLADSRERPLYYNTNNLAVIRMQGDSLIKVNEFARFPEFYKTNFINEPWPSAIRTGNKVYYVFSNDNILYAYDIVTGTTDSFRVEGLSPNERVPYNIDRIGDIAYTSEYEVQISSYVKLLHDKINNEFVVFQMLPVKEKQHNGMLFLYEDKPVLLNMIDSSMKVHNKIYFENNVDFGLRYIFYHNGKLYLPERFNRNHNSTTVKFYVYDLASVRENNS